MEEACNEDLSNAGEIESLEVCQAEQVEMSEHIGLHPATDRISQFATLFLLNAKEHYQLTQSSLNFIAQQMQQMISFTIDDIAEIVYKFIRDQNSVIRQRKQTKFYSQNNWNLFKILSYIYKQNICKLNIIRNILTYW